ncbi:hypothetical protein BU14_0166s0014 [Porphyra umbilicalis]|uniref:Uncharacterized protein n=1 Tax=Porphyra umbilicalis TaxID=2786 RepID=A0A1X6P7Z1_PORUM|nr:hypothetical protein BU14_0166s0014 [Porphyra umbilicalis]|eukprot:OSX76974.1 hypothetical protein BU14_0166s0014 [Porphyra umbilicalis]
MAPALASFLTRAGPTTWITPADVPAALCVGSTPAATLAGAAAAAAAAGCGVAVTPAPGGQGVAYAFAQVPSGGGAGGGALGRLLALAVLAVRVALGAGLAASVGGVTAVAAVATAFGGWGGGWWARAVVGPAPLLALGVDTASVHDGAAAAAAGTDGSSPPLGLLPALLAISAGDCRRARLDAAADGGRWAGLRGAIAAADGVIPAAVAAAHLGDGTASADAAGALAAGVLGGYAAVAPAPPGGGGGPAARRGTVVWAFPGLTPATAAAPAARARLRTLARSAAAAAGPGGADGAGGYTPRRPTWRPAGAAAAVGLVWVVVAAGQVAALAAIAVHLRATYVGGGGAVTRAARAVYPTARAYALAFVGGGLVRAVGTRRRLAEWAAGVERARRGGHGADADAAAAAAAAVAAAVRRRRSWEGVVGVPGVGGWGTGGGMRGGGGGGEGLYPTI